MTSAVMGVVTGANIWHTRRRTVRSWNTDVCVLIPARNEERTLPLLLEDLKHQDYAALSVIVGDDSSSDDTFTRAHAVINDDPRFHIQRCPPPPTGWNGKTAACHHLSQLTTAPVIIFIDADVRLQPHAISVAVSALLTQRSNSLVTLWPFQVAQSPLERCIQPILAWSWMTTAPQWISNHPALAVANGQFLAFLARDYHAVGGHRSVRQHPTEDLALARMLRRNGFKTSVVRAGRAVQCRMYHSSHELVDGYTRWLFHTFPPAAALAVGTVAALSLMHPVMWVALAITKAATRHSEGATPRECADAVLTHPAGVIGWIALVVQSHRRNRMHTRRWKGRTLP